MNAGTSALWSAKNVKVLWKWGIAVVLLCCLGAAAAHRFLWVRAYKARITCAGRTSAASRIYLNNENDLLVVLGEPEGGAYIINTRVNTVGIPMQGFWLKTGLLIGLESKSVLWTGDQSIGRFYPNLQLTGRSAEFTTYERQRVHLDW